MWANPTVDEDADAEVEPAEREPNHGESRPAASADGMSSESMLWLSDHCKSTSSGTTGRGQSIARQ